MRGVVGRAFPFVVAAGAAIDRVVIQLSPPESGRAQILIGFAKGCNLAQQFRFAIIRGCGRSRFRSTGQVIERGQPAMLTILALPFERDSGSPVIAVKVRPPARKTLRALRWDG